MKDESTRAVLDEQAEPIDFPKTSYSLDELCAIYAPAKLSSLLDTV